jgi:hypothetical protein
MTAPTANAPSPAGAQPAVPWNWGLRLVASLAILWHLVGVMVAPLSTPPRFDGPTSVIGAKLREAYVPYITALYLNHAYKFFAPNPGNSHLLRYDLHFADGTKQVNRDDQLLPDRFRHWPRLLYHRHFMITEFLNVPPWVWEPERVAASPGTEPLGTGPVGEAVPSVAEPIPVHYAKRYVEGIAAHLARRHGAARVDLYSREHFIPSIREFKDVGNRLDSPESYRERLILSYAPEPKP